MNVETTIYDDNDDPIIVTGYIIEGVKGMRDYYGQLETPDDPDEIEIHSATYINDEEIELTDAQLKHAEEQLWDNARMNQ